MKYRIVKVGEWDGIYYYIQMRILWIWFDEDDGLWFWLTYETAGEAEKEIRRRKKLCKKTIVKQFSL